ncbi:MAG: UPF0149 family protein [Methylomicrobium sp.]|nr:UPF0149 family protein [Methylomicrobium sp.]
MIYQTIDQTLRQQGAEVSAAEAHGIATGMLCVDVRASQSNWLDELFGEGSSAAGGNVVLGDLFEQTRALLTDDDYTFDLMLPDVEEDNLSEAVEAMRDWCQGFLFGIGFSQSSSNWTGEVGEIVKDIVEITKLEAISDDDDSEEGQEAFVEIQEYLRVAVQLIRTELSGSVGGSAH